MKKVSVVISIYFIVASLVTFTACTDPVNSNPIVEPPTNEPPISSWDGPTIVDSFKIGGLGVTCNERPLLYENQILQLFEVDQASGANDWHVGAYNWNEATINRSIDTIYSNSDRPNYKSMRCTQEGDCVFWGGITSRVFNVQSQTLSQKQFEGITQPFALADGSMWLTSLKMPSDSFFSIGIFDPILMDTLHLFRWNTSLSNYSFVSIREGFVSERDSEKFLYTQTEYYDRELGVSPSIIHCYNLTTNTLEWSKEYDRAWPEDGSQGFGLDDKYVYTHGYNRVVAYALETGETIWTYDGPSEESLSFCPVLVGGGRVYVFNDNGGVIGLNRESGVKETFTPDVEPTVAGADKFGDRYVLLGMGNSSIVIFNPETAQIDLSFKSPTHNLSAQRQFIWNNFSAYYDLGYIVAHDYEYVYVFDVSAY